MKLILYNCIICFVQDLDIFKLIKGISFWSKEVEELNIRFNEKAMELLTLIVALDPSDGYKSFDIESICKLAR